jgi:hypothetical protein
MKVLCGTRVPENVLLKVGSFGRVTVFVKPPYSTLGRVNIHVSITSSIIRRDVGIVSIG